jgi:hypothetical protein
VTYVHKKVPLNEGDTVVIDSSLPCRAYLMHECDYDSFLKNQGFRYADCSDTVMFDLNLSTTKLHVSHGGVWDMLLVFETRGEKFRYSVDILPEVNHHP